MPLRITSVSYTHLDVYKRQALGSRGATLIETGDEVAVHSERTVEEGSPAVNDGGGGRLSVHIHDDRVFPVRVEIGRPYEEAIEGSSVVEANG